MGGGQLQYNGSQQADQTEPSHWASHRGQQQPACPHQHGAAGMTGRSGTKSTIDDSAELGISDTKHFCKTVVELRTDLNLIFVQRPFALCPQYTFNSRIQSMMCSSHTATLRTLRPAEQTQRMKGDRRHKRQTKTKGYSAVCGSATVMR